MLLCSLSGNAPRRLVCGLRCAQYVANVQHAARGMQHVGCCVQDAVCNMMAGRAGLSGVMQMQSLTHGRTRWDGQYRGALGLRSARRYAHGAGAMRMAGAGGATGAQGPAMAAVAVA